METLMSHIVSSEQTSRIALVC